MKIIDGYAFRGRNIFSHKPVIKLVIDLEDYYDVPTNSIMNFNETLIRLLPGLKKHNCSRGYEGGFAERLDEGTYFAHVIEHAAIEIQNLLGYNVAFGKAIKGDIGSRYDVVYSYINEYAGLESGRLAVDLVNSILEKTDINFDDELKKIKKKCIETDLGVSTQMIKEEAEKRDIPIIRIGKDSLLQLGYGKNSRRLEATLSDNSTCISVDIACNKDLAKSIMSDYGIPVPEGKIVEARKSYYNTV